MSKEELLQFSQKPFWVGLRWAGFITFWLGFFAIVAAVIALIVLEEKCPEESLDWWQTEVIYQVYPRSFQDSDGDGVGDLKGVSSRLDYLQELGIGTIWMNPIYKSPMKDFGYDVSDYVDIDPIFGTMEEFEHLLGIMHEKGLKLVMDFVPNHSSDQHPWFVESRKSRDNEYSDYYVWVDKRDCNTMSCDTSCSGNQPQGCPPNNWLSVPRGSAWKWDQTRQQYYLHTYLAEQPDLNFNNPKVVKEMQDILLFWLDKGVDGFRLDAVSHIHEDTDYYNKDEPPSNKPNITADDYKYLKHIYTLDLPDTIERLREFRQVMNEYGTTAEKHIFSVNEVYITEYTDVETITKHYDVADMPFNFDLIGGLGPECHTGACIYGLVNTSLGMVPEGRWSNWVLGNHDEGRIASKMGGTYESAMNALLLLLPGTPTTYYGEEIGMLDHGSITFNETRDPRGLILGPDRYQEHSRDPARTPMQWDSSEPSAGFSTNPETWLPMHPDYKTINVQLQVMIDNSTLNTYKALVALRAKRSFQEGDLVLATPTDNLFAFSRNFKHGEPSYLCVMNVGYEAELYASSEDVTANNEGEVVVKYGTRFKIGDKIKIDEQIQLDPGELVVVEFYFY
ncbi:PREDICTED: maltase 2-like isoform X3 [Priapulus caudatus]|nr:PREDICTED: maltase 2-like isoform X3 [Priapulus caudatus]